MAETEWMSRVRYYPYDHSKSPMHVRGIPGSGKTWLCNAAAKLGIQCIDTDDVFQETFSELYDTCEKFRHSLDSTPRGKRLPWWLNIVPTLGRRKVRREIKTAKKNGKLLIIVGITLGNFPGTRTFFIKLDRFELETAYRRLMLREIEKFISNKDLLRNVIETQPVNRIGPLIEMRTNIAVEVGLGFSAYKNMYRNALKFEKGRGSLIMSQSEILDVIEETTVPI